MINAVAIDDEPLALEVLRNFAAQIEFIQLVDCFTRTSPAHRYLEQEQIDLLFLDIRMPDVSGIDFLRSLPRPPAVIFTTAYSEHAVQSFELDAVDFLVKPFSLARFRKACTKAADLQSLRQLQTGIVGTPATLFIKSGYEQVRVSMAEIRYVESIRNYVQFVLADRKVTARMTMSDVEQLLKKGGFLRIHRSYLVATSRITKIEKRRIWLGSKELPIGEAYQPAIETFSKLL